jgi:pyrroloquinoline quinone biosynthesis protein B
MKLAVLGTAAGGGFPQWNCACPPCTAARAGTPTVAPRAQDGLAISATGRDWYLLNVSPDIRAQTLAQPLLAPGPGPRDTPIRGALLTDAELDHTAGLLTLREADTLQVWAPTAVLTALATTRAVIDRYHRWTWTPATTAFDLDDTLHCRILAVHDKPPRYAEAAPGPWAVAYRITDTATGATIVYAPCLREWPTGFDEFVADAAHVLLDGTFYRADELTTATGEHRDQASMGHLPITDSLPLLRPGPRWHYTHLNNTNPLLDTAAPQWAEIQAADADVLFDGTVLDL